MKPATEPAAAQGRIAFGRVAIAVLCAFAGSWVYVGLWHLQAPGWLALLACVGVTAGLRGLALWRNWQLPTWRL